MSLQAVEQVMETEQKNRERRTAAEQQAKQLAADAERNGLALLNNVRAQADAEGKELLRKAEERAKQRSGEIRAEAERRAGELRAAAQTRLEQAAELIVGRVVR